MATTTTQTGRVVIEIDGTPPVFVDQVSLPVRSFPVGGLPDIGPFEASVVVSQAGALLDWVMSLSRGKVVESAGAVVVANVNLDRQRRFAWTGGNLIDVALSTLDARGSKQPFLAVFKWQPTGVTSTKDSGKLLGTTSKKQKAWLCSNFKLDMGGLPGIGAKVVKVELPTVTRKLETRPRARRAPALPPEFGTLRLTVAASGIDAARDWVQTVQDQGGARPEDEQTVSINMLDSALSKTLGTIRLDGCSLLAWEESPLETSSSTLRTGVLSFAVQGMDLQVVA